MNYSPDIERLLNDRSHHIEFNGHLSNGPPRATPLRRRDRLHQPTPHRQALTTVQQQSDIPDARATLPVALAGGRLRTITAEQRTRRLLAAWRDHRLTSGMSTQISPVPPLVFHAPNQRLPVHAARHRTPAALLWPNPITPEPDGEQALNEWQAPAVRLQDEAHQSLPYRSVTSLADQGSDKASPRRTRTEQENPLQRTWRRLTRLFPQRRQGSVP
ncbi:hypothetical protein ABZY03_30490 [Streptomyces klenkii]|uniref:hypothetical protein n=1 Tax=Streptomyces klenkii TaxID=1420899 RepID=UPI0033AA4B30